MSRMRSDRKPPLANARSPPSLRPPRRVLRSNIPSLQTPPVSQTKSAKPTRTWNTEEPDLRPISTELRALAKKVQSEFGAAKPDKAGFENCSGARAGIENCSGFERGRMYEEYSARRNERLKRKMGGEAGDEPRSVYGLGVNVESGKRREATKKRESLRKSIATAYAAETQTPRYSLRSMSKDKENKKPPLPVNVNSDKSSLFGSERKIGVRRAGRI